LRWIGHEIQADADLGSVNSLAEAHRLTQWIETKLTQAMPKLSVAVVHAYPTGPGVAIPANIAV